MSKILILYSTVDGHTRKICERLRAVLEPGGHAVTLSDLDDRPSVDLQSFDKIVIGASIRYGKHRPNVAAFMRTHRATLQAKPSAFFSVNIVARKPNRNTPETNPYVRKLLAQIGWRPRQLGVFAGKLDYPTYGFWDRQIIRFIMLLTRGPTDPRTVTEFTDWAQVERFARTVAEL
jgi:menaquinone-dependent protoporphyrinogen oxidase